MGMTLADWRIYSAEQSIGDDESMTLAEMQEYVANLAEKPWWREIFPSSLPIHVVDGGYLSDDGSAVSYTQPDAYPRPAKYTISMHPRMLTNRILIHELAHCVTPSLAGDPESIRSGEDLADRTTPHGALFTASLAVLTARLLPDGTESLRRAMEAFDVSVAHEVDLLEAIRFSDDVVSAVEHRQAELHREQEELAADYTARTGKAFPGIIPQFGWGEWIRTCRRDRKTTQKVLADRISTVTPCSPRHISQLERARQRPTEDRQLKRAMLAGIYFGLDPIWLRTEKQLTRWDCGDITIEEAARVDHDWAALVEWMNQTIQRHPPRWTSPGLR